MKSIVKETAQAKERKEKIKQTRTNESMALVEAMCLADKWTFGAYKKYIEAQKNLVLEEEKEQQKKSWTSSIIPGFKPNMSRPELDLLDKVFRTFTAEELALPAELPQTKSAVFRRMVQTGSPDVKQQLSIAKNIFSQHKANLQIHRCVRERFVNGLAVPNNMQHLEAMVFSTMEKLPSNVGPKAGGYMRFQRRYAASHLKPNFPPPSKVARPNITSRKNRLVQVV
jgi:hypothetical protein